MRLQRVEIECGDKKIDLYEVERAGERFTGTFRECLLFYKGYGADQAAELRYKLQVEAAGQIKKRRLMSQSRRSKTLCCMKMF